MLIIQFQDIDNAGIKLRVKKTEDWKKDLLGVLNQTMKNHFSQSPIKQEDIKEAIESDTNVFRKDDMSRQVQFTADELYKSLQRETHNARGVVDISFDGELEDRKEIY